MNINPKPKGNFTHQSINFKRWIEEKQHVLLPPVGNQQIWKYADMILTAVGAYFHQFRVNAHIC